MRCGKPGTSSRKVGLDWPCWNCCTRRGPGAGTVLHVCRQAQHGYRPVTDVSVIFRNNCVLGGGGWHEIGAHNCFTSHADAQKSWLWPCFQSAAACPAAVCAVCTSSILQGLYWPVLLHAHTREGPECRQLLLQVGQQLLLIQLVCTPWGCHAAEGVQVQHAAVAVCGEISCLQPAGWSLGVLTAVALHQQI